MHEPDAYLAAEKKRCEAAQDTNLASLNNSETEAVKQLITVATVFLTASLFLIEHNTFQEGSTVVASFAVATWIALTLSMCLGAAIFVSDIAFFRKWVEAHRLMIEAIDGDEVRTREDVDARWQQLTEQLPDETPDMWLKLEIATLVLGIVCLFVAIFAR